MPLWILGSSLYGAQLAAMLGLPYAFASHFAPEALLPALEIYRVDVQAVGAARRRRTRWSERTRSSPTRTTRRGASSPRVQQSFTNIFRGARGRLPPPIDDIESYWSPLEKERASAMLQRSFVGAPDTVRSALEAFVVETGADEIIVAAAIHDHGARLRSYELLSEAAGRS